MATATAVLATEGLVVRLSPGKEIVRVHWRANGPVWFGPAVGAVPGRFDAPGGQYGTMYAAEDLAGAFAETVLRRAARIVAWPNVAKRSWSVLGLRREVTLAKLHGDGLVSWGVTGDITTGDDYRPSREMALALHGMSLDGIAYRSRHNNDQICYALFDTVDPSDLLLVSTMHFSDSPDRAEQLIRQHKAAWDPLLPLPSLAALP